MTLSSDSSDQKCSTTDVNNVLSPVLYNYVFPPEGATNSQTHIACITSDTSSVDEKTCLKRVCSIKCEHSSSVSSPHHLFLLWSAADFTLCNGHVSVSVSPVLCLWSRLRPVPAVLLPERLSVQTADAGGETQHGPDSGWVSSQLLRIYTRSDRNDSKRAESAIIRALVLSKLSFPLLNQEPWRHLTKRQVRICCYAKIMFTWLGEHFEEIADTNVAAAVSKGVE